MAYFTCPKCGEEDSIIEFQQVTVTNGIEITKEGDHYVIEYDYDVGSDPEPWANDPNSGYECGECGYELPLESGGHDALMEYLGLPQAGTKEIEIR